MVAPAGHYSNHTWTSSKSYFVNLASTWRINVFPSIFNTLLEDAVVFWSRRVRQ